MGRFNNRIANRVQSRIRSRMDRSYDPQANAMSPFKASGGQVRKSGTLRAFSLFFVSPPIDVRDASKANIGAERYLYDLQQGSALSPVAVRALTTPSTRSVTSSFSGQELAPNSQTGTISGRVSVQ